MKMFFWLVIFAAPGFCWAESYNCSVRNHVGQTKVWSGTLDLGSKSKAVAEVRIIMGDGSERNLSSLLGTDQASLQKNLKPYDGFLAIALKKDAHKIYLSSAHVDLSNSANNIPFDAMAWGSAGIKEVGLEDYKKNLEVSCSRK